MQVERIWSGNRLRNYHYLVGCEETGEALAVDPLQWQDVLARAKDKGWTITQILNTHEHPDHIGGNEGLRAATGARVLAHAKAAARIGGVDRGLAEGDTIRIGRSVELECLDTPGHTMTHICAFAHGDRPALFSGDTLFNAGAGNCHNGGDPEVLYDTFARRISTLPAATLLYVGHDYLLNNLAFTLDREPDNAAASALLGKLKDTGADALPVLTLGEEQAYNTFLRLTSPVVIATLRARFPDLPAAPTPKAVFLKLRELRNAW